MRYTVEQLDVIAKKLRAMPAIEKKKVEVTKKEAVKILAKDIQALQKRGYTLPQIYDVLKGEGIEMSLPTLKSYLRNTKNSSSNESVQNGATASAPRKETFAPTSDTLDI